MKDFKYYSENPVHYPSAKDFTFYHVYQGQECIAFNCTTDTLANRIPEINEALKGYQYDPKPNEAGRGPFPSCEFINFLNEKGIFVVKVNDKEGYKAQKALYRENEKRLLDEFTADILEEFGLISNSKAMVLFNKAWERGHSSGFAEVYSEFEDLVELIN